MAGHPTMTSADHLNNCPLAREVIELGHYEDGRGKKFITGTDGWRELSMVTRHSGDAQFFDWPSCEAIRMPGQEALDWMRGRAVLPPYEPKPLKCPCGAPYPKSGACYACGQIP